MKQKKPKNRFWLFSLILFIFLQIGDGLSTYILSVKTSLGWAIEGNPLVRYVLESLGIVPGLILLKAMAILVGYFIYTCIVNGQTSSEASVGFFKRMFLIPILVYIIVNIYNWYLVYIT